MATMARMTNTISEMYVVQFLLQNTLEGSPAVNWYEKEQGGYIAHVSGVQVELNWEHSVVGSRVVVTLSRGLERIHVAEPRCTTLSGKYRTEEQRNMAELMRNLAAAIAAHCASREVQPPETRERIKNAIFRQLLFHEPPD